MKSIVVSMIIGFMVSVCHGQTLESLRAGYSNDLARVELKKAEAMKVALSEYSLGLEKVRAGYVKDVNFKGVKAVDTITNEIQKGNIVLESTFPEILASAKKYKDAESFADKGVETSKKAVLEKYLMSLKKLCAEYMKSDMDKAEKVNNEMEMVASLLKEYCSDDKKVGVDEGKPKENIVKKTTIPSSAKAYKGHHYHVVDKPVTWASAMADAESRGGYLVRIKDKEEQDTVAGFLREAGRPRGYPEGLVWVGAEYKNMRWTWLDGTSVDSSLWAKNRKSKGNNNTVAFLNSKEGLKEGDRGGVVWYMIEWDE
jgi:hypothetical protein